MKKRFNINKLKKLAFLLGVQDLEGYSKNELIDKIVDRLSLTTTPHVADEYRLKYYSRSHEEEIEFLLQDLGANSLGYFCLTKQYLKELAKLRLEQFKLLNEFYYKVNKLNQKYLQDLNIPLEKL